MATHEQEMGGPGTAVATIQQEPEQQIALSPAAQEAKAELAQLRAQGAALVERGKIIQATRRMLNGMVWGAGSMAVSGSQLSEGTLTAIARVCVNLDADPALHINLLGNTLFLNAAFWTRELNQAIQDGIVRTWRLENISPRFEAQIRKQAEQAFKDADEFKDEASREEGRRYLSASRYAPAARAFHEIPEQIEKNPLAAIYEVVIEFPTDRDAVREANYAPNSDRDPVGRARPGETARTRTLRRGAIKALPKIGGSEMKAASEGLNADWAIIVEEKKATAQLASGPQAVATGGEPSAAPAAGAKPLPVEEPAPQQPAAQPTPPPPFDRKKARGGFFASLKESSVADEDRKRWAKDNGFAESTNDWSEADFARAREILTAPVRDSVLARLKAREIDLADMMQQTCGKAPAEAYLVDWKTIQKKLDMMDDEDGNL